MTGNDEQHNQTPWRIACQEIPEKWYESDRLDILLDNLMKIGFFLGLPLSVFLAWQTFIEKNLPEEMYLLTIVSMTILYICGYLMDRNSTNQLLDDLQAVDQDQLGIEFLETHYLVAENLIPQQPTGSEDFKNADKIELSFLLSSLIFLPYGLALSIRRILTSKYNQQNRKRLQLAQEYIEKHTDQ